MVDRAFEKLDPECAGAITCDVFYSNFNLNNHPEVASGQRHPDEIAAKYLDAFDMRERASNGLITRDDFSQKYREISASYPHDDEAFAKMVTCVWGLAR